MRIPKTGHSVWVRVPKSLNSMFLLKIEVFKSTNYFPLKEFFRVSESFLNFLNVVTISDGKI